MLEARPDLFSSLVTFGTVGELKYSTLMTKIISGIDKAMLRWSPRRYLNFLSKNTSKYESVQKEVFDMFMMSTEAVPYIRENLGNYSYLNIIDQAGHIANLDKPDEFNKILAGFWKQVAIEN